MLANLQSALETYDASPSSASAGQGVVTAADDLAQSLNTGAAAVQSVRETADSDIASAVDTVNSLLDPVHPVNATIVSGTATRRRRLQRRRHARQHSQPVVAASRHLDRRQSRRLDVDLHRQRRDAVPGRRGAHRQLHPDPDL